MAAHEERVKRARHSGHEEAPVDILTAIAIELPCNVCGRRYEVTLAQVLLSKDTLLHEGCQVRRESECPPLAYATLLERELIENLEATWQRLEQGARAVGGNLRLRQL